ncbi:hypothetical protein [Dyadobacter sp. CY347]|uniref:hypothetical protein n=1 Tax=Dyadobacter sp. CY347 TaxID=2909336 RepID=UPI001F363846|nr:hypothetical protein [Dyadobacter sp. CY347]MCF2488962.1 hypothetical protein [Dyadobacter sp. CY347]
MKNRTLHLHIWAGKQLYRKFKPAVVAFAFLCAGQNAFSQNVGINTNNPDPSASLEVAGADKGLLIPRIALQSLTDNATIPNPATALLIYNTNAGIGKRGFFYNSGTSGNPVWSEVGVGTATLTLPFSQLGTNSGPLFLINNNDANAGAIAISGLAANAVGVRGATLSGTGVVGHTASGGKGITASAANVNGTALEVNGRVQIHGPGQTIGAGKVLTSDDNGYATWQNAGVNVAFSASGIKGGGSEKLPPGISKVPFAVEEYDLGNNYSDVNAANHSTFTAPLNGIYRFEMALNFNGQIQDPGFKAGLALIRTRNGASTQISELDVQFEANGIIAYSRTCEAVIGDQFHINVYISKAGVELFVQPDANYFSGHLVARK